VPCDDGDDHFSLSKDRKKKGGALLSDKVEQHIPLAAKLAA
jgi:hypothetical protein